MTGKWAATNTLREHGRVHLLAPHGQGRGCIDNCAACAHDAALALMEAALDAAEHYLNGTDPDGYINLAAALRAVREGK